MSLSTCLHHPHHSREFFFFFSQRGDPVRHLLLLDTDSKRIKKREERSNNTPRSPQRRENLREPGKAFPRVRLERLSPGGERAPAAPRGFIGVPWLGWGILAHPTEIKRKSGKRKENPFLSSRNNYRAFFPTGKNR